MASATTATSIQEQFEEHPCTYMDRTTSSTEFDRRHGYYTEYEPDHEYTIRLQGKDTYKEYVFHMDRPIKKPTLEELMTISNNTYTLYTYNTNCKNLRNYRSFRRNKLTGEGTEIKLDPTHKDYNYDEGHIWAKHGICYDYHYNDRLYVYDYGENYGWEVERRYKYDVVTKTRTVDEVCQRLMKKGMSDFGGRNCLGYRIMKDGVTIKDTISPEDLILYGEPPSFP